MTNNVALLGWLDRHPSLYIWLAGSLITTALAWAIFSLWRSDVRENRNHDWAWSAVILAILVAGRWPTLLVSREFNPDESRHLAGAHALLQDPVFWRSVDGATSGPLDYFALCPAGWLCGWDTYVPARLTALLLLGLCFTLLHQGLAMYCGRGAARIASLAAVSFEALSNSFELLYYTSELMPLALMAAALYAAAQRWLRNGGPLWCGLGGLLLGAVPFAKLQAAPLAACLGVGWLIAELRAMGPTALRRRVYLLGGAVLPAVLFAWQLTIAGLWRDFVFSYFQANFHYTSVGHSSWTLLITGAFDKSAREDGLLHLWLPGTLLWFVLMVRFRPLSRRAAWFGIAGGIAAGLITATLILCPGRIFLHYWHLSILPGIFLLGVLIENLLATSSPTRIKSELGLVAVCACALVGTLLVQRVRHPNLFVGSLSFFLENPRTALAAQVAKHARPGESIAIWGWSSYVYVEAGLWPAAREADFVSLIEPGPYQQKYRMRFLVDLLRIKPPVFLDSSGPSSLIYTSPTLAHDRSFPELAAVIRAYYVQVDELSGARIYRRRDLTGR